MQKIHATPRGPDGPDDNDQVARDAQYDRQKRKPFTQIEDCLNYHPLITQSAKHLYGYLAFRGRNSTVYARLDTMAEDLLLSERTVIRAMQELRVLGLVQRTPQAKHESYVTRIVPITDAVERRLALMEGAVSRALRNRQWCTLTDTVIAEVRKECWPGDTFPFLELRPGEVLGGMPSSEQEPLSA